ncbi:hypothetical protein [Mesorhizobium sp. LNHC209A00]|uniref:hypothetical protein n=1 Tax=Mesorhizobium TaxID=68287 RepID=UPI00040A10B2|nr:hypothetical protein [Mesorhizobium sp. LNHC209A00]
MFGAGNVEGIAADQPLGKNIIDDGGRCRRWRFAQPTRPSSVSTSTITGEKPSSSPNTQA